MANIRNLEQRAREAILKNTIENYKQQRKNWLQEPAIRKAILVYSFFRWQNAVLIAGTILAAGCLPLFLFSTLGWASVLIPLFLGLVAEMIFLFFSSTNISS